jgi:hypothetical protein
MADNYKYHGYECDNWTPAQRKQEVDNGIAYLKGQRDFDEGFFSPPANDEARRWYVSGMTTNYLLSK